MSTKVRKIMHKNNRPVAVTLLRRRLHQLEDKMGIAHYSALEKRTTNAVTPQTKVV